MTRVGCAVVLGALLLAPSAFGKPNVWARAARPKVAREADATRHADEVLSRDYTMRRTSNAIRRRILLRKTLAMLRRAGAETSTNPKIRYRLAQIHYALFEVDADLVHIEHAVEHFELVAAARAFPRTERARALASLAICYARLNRHAEETEAYSRAIALQPDPFAHTVLLANQAEGFMARGFITAAVQGYRASLDATPTPLMIESGVTTMWGLGVALDRSGDLDGAIENVRRARSYDPGDIRINGDNWFYVPSYDVHWYRALGHWQIARDAKNPDVKRAAYDAAVASWRSFVDEAAPTDPWLAIGGFRSTQCEAERVTAMGRALARPAPPEDPPLWP